VWDSETFDLTATSVTEALTITGLSTRGGDYIGIDNADLELASVVPVSTAVPEASTLVLFGTSLFGVGWIARRRRT
jgi:hypothetical protein